MILNLGLCLAGLIALIAGAELLVWGGAALAARLGVPPLIVGLTIVAIGTSTPELAVGIRASAQGNGALAIGNIAGANAINILLILGLSALIRPLPLAMQTLKLELPVMAFASLAFLALAWDGRLTRFDGAVLLLCALAFTLAVIRFASRESRAVSAEFDEEFGVTAQARRRRIAAEAAALAAGIAIVVLGAHWLVEGAVDLARSWGVSDAFIGLTIFAIGTTAPEFVTTLLSTIRDERDIAIGNLIGSSIYNILFILGMICLLSPGGIEIDRELVAIDIPVTAAVALLCLPTFMSGRRVSRFEGGLFMILYAGYLGFLILTRT